MMQVIKIGQTKLFVIMQGCIFNLTDETPCISSHMMYHTTTCCVFIYTCNLSIILSN